MSLWDRADDAATPGAAVVATNICRACRTPITLLSGVGWVHHGQGPRVDVCVDVEPAWWHCPVCGRARPSRMHDPAHKVDAHTRPIVAGLGGSPCPGSGRPGVDPLPDPVVGQLPRGAA